MMRRAQLLLSLPLVLTAACAAPADDDASTGSAAATSTPEAATAVCDALKTTLDGASVAVAFDAHSAVTWQFDVRKDSTCTQQKGQADYEATFDVDIEQKSTGSEEAGLDKFFAGSRRYAATISAPISSFSKDKLAFVIAPQGQFDDGLADIDQRYFRIELSPPETVGAPRSASLTELRMFTRDTAAAHDVTFVPQLTADQRKRCSRLAFALQPAYELAKGSDQLVWKSTPADGTCTVRRGRSSYELVMRAELDQKSTLTADDDVSPFLQGNRKFATLVSMPDYDLGTKIPFTIVPDSGDQMNQGLTDVASRYFSVSFDAANGATAHVAEYMLYTKDILATHEMTVVFSAEGFDTGGVD